MSASQRSAARRLEDAGLHPSFPSPLGSAEGVERRDAHPTCLRADEARRASCEDARAIRRSKRTTSKSGRRLCVRSHALIWRLFYCVSGPRFPKLLLRASRSASSWRGVRSDPRVEPRDARWRDCEPRQQEPHPAPLSERLMSAPLGEQGAHRNNILRNIIKPRSRGCRHSTSRHIRRPKDSPRCGQHGQSRLQWRHHTERNLALLVEITLEFALCF